MSVSKAADSFSGRVNDVAPVALPTAATIARIVSSHHLSLESTALGGPPVVRPGMALSSEADDEVPPLHFGVIPFLLEQRGLGSHADDIANRVHRAAK